MPHPTQKAQKAARQQTSASEAKKLDAMRKRAVQKAMKANLTPAQRLKVLQGSREVRKNLKMAGVL